MLNRRILIVDDNKDIHIDFRKILLPKNVDPSHELNNMEDELFGNEGVPTQTQVNLDWSYEVDSAYQGQEALAMVEKAMQDGRPYALVFMDVRMPPGWDGIETIKHIWVKAPFTEVVLCTAYSDYSSDDIINTLGVSHRLLFLKKPFDSVAIKQMALGITTKWNFEAESRELVDQLEQAVANRTRDLSATVEKLMSTNQELDTSLKKLGETQALLVQSSKMSALGEMAGGIAHEINNPLAIIQMNAFRVQSCIEDEPFDKAEATKAAQCIEATTQRIANIISGLRSFSRDGAQDSFNAASIKKIIDDTLSFCSEKFKDRGIKIKLPPIEVEIVAECRAVQIAQVLLNLLNNAFDAVEDLPEKWVEITCKDEGDTICISVTDSGSGIDAEIQKKIFQPFFTTKEIGKGTGLGLSVSIGILEAHKGSLLLDRSCPNTRFLLRFPKVQGLTSPAKSAA